MSAPAELPPNQGLISAVLTHVAAGAGARLMKVAMKTKLASSLPAQTHATRGVAWFGPRTQAEMKILLPKSYPVAQSLPGAATSRLASLELLELLR